MGRYGPGMPEQTITATHLRRNLGAVLEAVLKGRTVHVERNGRPLCTITPPTDSKGTDHDEYARNDRGESDR